MVQCFVLFCFLKRIKQGNKKNLSIQGNQPSDFCLFYGYSHSNCGTKTLHARNANTLQVFKLRASIRLSVFAQMRRPQSNTACCRHTFYSGFILWTNTEHTDMATRQLKPLIPRLFVFPFSSESHLCQLETEPVNTEQVQDNIFLCAYIFLGLCYCSCVF